MADTDPKSIDIFGIKPVADAINTVVKGTVDGTAALLGRICLPAAEELGFYLKDRVGNWRARNLVTIAEKAEKKLEAIPNSEKMSAHPRLVWATVENGSWAESDEVQEMWAGLLASSCTEDGQDDSNLLFINLLNQLTTPEAKILNHCCQNVDIYLDVTTRVIAERLRYSIDDLMRVAGIDDIDRARRELEHLRAIGLIDCPDLGAPTVKPTGLALQMYVRCQGSRLAPAKYFRLA